MINSLLSKRKIQEKFTFIMAAASLVALVMLTTTIVLYEVYSYRSKLLKDLNIQGAIIIEHLDVAIDIQDQISASKSLSAFSSNPNISKALVITPDNVIFSSYTALNSVAAPPPEEKNLFHGSPLESGYTFSNNTLTLIKTIGERKELFGYLYIEHNVPFLAYRLPQYMPLFFIIAFTLGLMNLLISLGVRRFIVSPMTQLTKTANRISVTHNYSLRSNFTSNDEIGTLASTLNELLSITETYQNSLLSNNVQLGEQTVEVEKERRRAENARRDYQKLAKSHELLLNSANEGIIELDIEGYISFANPKAQKILDMSKEDIRGENISRFFATQQVSAIDDNTLEMLWRSSNIHTAMKSGKPCKVEDEIWVSATNSSFHIGYNFSAILDEDQFCTGGVLMFEDITSRKNANKKLVELANYDSLTHLSNRRYFYDALSHAMSRAHRSNSVLAILYLDLDHFKQVNDTYGHDAGDRVLVKVAQSLQRCIRSGDVLSRLAGDEFAILLFDIRSAQNAQFIAEKIVSELAEPHVIHDRQVYASASVGIAMYPGIGNDCDDVLRAADAAMYQVKKMGRKGIQFFESKLQREVEVRNRITQDLNNSIFDDEFEVVYQPKFSLTEGRMVGIEALLRWYCRGELIPPDIFIPIAEESGKICDIGEWVLQRVCRQVGEWQKNIAQCRDIGVAVNVSPRQLRTGGFDQTIRHALENSNLEPDCLEIEITETAVMADPEAAIEELCRIRKLGVKISIDDFGIGYSSLNYLKRLPINKLKIDKSFTMDIGKNKNDEAIVRAVIAIGHSLNFHVIAEGVEDFEQLIFLDQNKCDQVQGYFFSKPLSVSDFSQLFLDDSWKYANLFKQLDESRVETDSLPTSFFPGRVPMGNQEQSDYGV